MTINARRVDAGRHVRLRSSKPVKLKTQDGREVEVEGNCDGVVLMGINKSVWLIHWLNGTRDGLEAIATSRMLSIVDDPPPALAPTGSNTDTTTAPRANSRNNRRERNQGAKKKKKKNEKVVFPTAEELLNAYASDFLIVHPEGYIKDKNDYEDEEADDSTSTSSLPAAEDDENGDNENGNGEKGEHMDAEELEEDNHPNLDLPPPEEPVDESSSKYRLKKAKYEKEKLEIIERGYKVSCKDGRVWKAVENLIPDMEVTETDYVGVQRYEFERLCGGNKVGDHHALMDLFALLWPGDWKDQMDNINSRISNKRKNGKDIDHISQCEFWKFMGIMIISASIGEGGTKLWPKDFNKDIPIGYQANNESFDASKFMPYWRFAQLKPLFALMFMKAKEKQNDWDEIRAAVDGFNQKRKIYVSAAAMKVLDEMMCAWRPRRDKTGGIPHLSFIARKPKPFGKCNWLRIEIGANISPFLASFSGAHFIHTQVPNSSQAAAQKRASYFILRSKRVQKPCPPRNMSTSCALRQVAPKDWPLPLPHPSHPVPPRTTTAAMKPKIMLLMCFAATLGLPQLLLRSHYRSVDTSLLGW